ncbi:MULTISPECIES: heme exporter protein CcmD [unclassified Marinobacter]|jgi:heme exporter protein D|uniref:heme exporter protein CcmD n=1 Tax=unclassified Marinobacter TaxID=83889 RepID=UPI000E94B52A|nr:MULTISPECIES: heme exporter protein CcmD [unclassified Marinobacter]HBM48570.1 heme exporter protein CcmD [Marinobacter sp.]|tara:strand:+ start:895 stop:1131 length:237 start_codon:yes stop_codon:yes gene_type:complete
MAFDSFSAFIAMEGHGPYVWACYAVFVVLLGGLMIWSARRNRAVYDSCRRRLEQQQGSKDSVRPKAAATFTRVEVSQD